MGPEPFVLAPAKDGRLYVPPHDGKAVDVIEKSLYVADFDGNCVWELDPSSGKHLNTIEVSKEAHHS